MTKPTGGALKRSSPPLSRRHNSVRQPPWAERQDSVNLPVDDLEAVSCQSGVAYSSYPDAVVLRSRPKPVVPVPGPERRLSGTRRPWPYAVRGDVARPWFALLAAQRGGHGFAHGGVYGALEAAMPAESAEREGVFELALRLGAEREADAVVHGCGIGVGRQVEYPAALLEVAL